MSRRLLLFLVSILLASAANAAPITYDLFPASQLGSTLTGSITIEFSDAVPDEGVPVSSDDVSSWSIVLTDPGGSTAFGGNAAIIPNHLVATPTSLSLPQGELDGQLFNLADIDGDNAVSISWQTEDGSADWQYDAGVTTADGTLLWKAMLNGSSPVVGTAVHTNEPRSVAMVVTALLTFGLVRSRLAF